MEITVNHIRINYEKHGSGAPLLLLHGNGEDLHLFDDLTPLLAKTHTVYALDSRDHGQSERGVALTYELMAEDVRAFLRELNLMKVTLIGFSDGAITAMLVASASPRRIHKLVLAGGNLTPRGVRWAARTGVRLAYLKHRDPLLGLMLHGPHISQKQLRAITAQTLVLTGAKDVITRKESIAIASGIPGSILQIVPNAEHSDYVKDAGRFYPLIRAFVSPTPEA
ncbi:alpha/beta fold hydrolase [Lacticaseibacillus yichunensis]|uniref:Alpha/beta fold hydrolase n=2 Tax=Bacilli TaxID=91061 RepID=A0ABW4CQN7_9LACO|nr:alpha/beta hydrolase [Lacticaseibacillus yichunensis]